MDRLLQGMWEYAAVHLDYLVVYSQTWDEHLFHLQRVLEQLGRAGLTANPKKCQFGMLQCVYLGHVVGNGVVKLEVGKLEAVQKFPRPTSKRQVRGFLGLTGYYRKFIPNYAALALPLTDLTRKNAPSQVQWSEVCETAFQQLKGLLCQSPILWAPDFTREFVLQTDASERGVEAVLGQRYDSGFDHPVAYFSKKLLPREERYSTVKKECLGVKLGVQAFRTYLLGRHFTIETDHRALEWLDHLKENNPCLTRWSISLQPYRFTVKHRPGVENGNPDALSRMDWCDK